MHAITTAWIAITAVSTVISLVTGVIVLYDLALTSRIERAEKETLPIKIRRSISYSQLVRGFEKVHRILDEIRFVPDVVVGIHYQGLSMASILAKLLYVPVKNAEIVYEERQGQRDIDKVIFDFNPGELLLDRKVLIVDNSIQTGRTLKLVKEEILRYTPRVKVLVVYKQAELAQSVVQPDLILFASDTPRKLLR